MRTDKIQKAMESIAEGIREELDNATRAATLADRIAAMQCIASLTKRLRTVSNREQMELHRRAKVRTPVTLARTLLLRDNDI